MRDLLTFVWREMKKIRLLKRKVYIAKGALFGRTTNFEGHNTIGRACHLYGCHVGEGTYMGDDCVFNNTYIGRYCALGACIRVSLGNHPIHNIVSIHPAFYSKKKQAGFTFCDNEIWESAEHLQDDYSCLIGNDVWIGDRVTILGGVNIADGTVVGAGAVVTRDTEPFGIYVGIPAKKIGSRFNDNQVSWLLEKQWWNSDFYTLQKNVNLFSNIYEFIKYFEGK